MASSAELTVQCLPLLIIAHHILMEGKAPEVVAKRVPGDPAGLPPPVVTQTTQSSGRAAKGDILLPHLPLFCLTGRWGGLGRVSDTLASKTMANMVRLRQTLRTMGGTGTPQNQCPSDFVARCLLD